MKSKFEEFFIVLCHQLQISGLTGGMKRCLPSISKGTSISPWNLFLYDLSKKIDLKPFLDDLVFENDLGSTEVRETSGYLFKFGMDEDCLFRGVSLDHEEFITLGDDGVREYIRISRYSECSSDIQAATAMCCNQYIDYDHGRSNFIVDMCSIAMPQSEITRNLILG